MSVQSSLSASEIASFVRRFLVESIVLLRWVSVVDVVLANVGVCVAIFVGVIAVHLNTILALGWEVSRHQNLVALVVISDTRFKVFLPNSILPQLGQEESRAGLLELQVHPAISCRDNALWRIGDNAELVNGDTGAPAAVRAVGEGLRIVGSGVSDNLVFSRSSEDVLHTKFPCQELSKDCEVILARFRSPEDEGGCLVLAVLLEGEVLQFLALVGLIVGIRKDDLVGEVGRLGEADSDGDLSLLRLDDTDMMRDEEHATLEEVGLDQWQVLEVLQVNGGGQQLPFRLVSPVAVDELLRVSQEVEVIILIDLKVKNKTCL